MKSARVSATIWRNPHGAIWTPVAGAIGSLLRRIGPLRNDASGALPDAVVPVSAPAGSGEGTGKPIRPIMRQIDERDLPELIDLIVRGFDTPRPRAFWDHFFSCLGRRSAPAGYPRFGYVLVHDGRLVGVIVLIYSTHWEDGVANIRCCGSTVYTEPEFRCYAPLLYARPHKDKNVTILNITAMPHTHKMIESMGFKKYSTGLLAALPLLSRASAAASVRIVGPEAAPDAMFDAREHALLREHADFGCTSFWCVADGQAFPFVFRTRKVKFRLPVDQLVYCRDINDLARFARPIGLFFARRLHFILLVNYQDPIPGLFGLRYGENACLYFRGPDRPRLGDLAYTETSMFGI